MLHWGLGRSGLLWLIFQNFSAHILTQKECVQKNQYLNWFGQRETTCKYVDRSRGQGHRLVVSVQRRRGHSGDPNLSSVCFRFQPPPPPGPLGWPWAIPQVLSKGLGAQWAGGVTASRAEPPHMPPQLLALPCTQPVLSGHRPASSARAQPSVFFPEPRAQWARGEGPTGGLGWGWGLRWVCTSSLVSTSAPALCVGPAPAWDTLAPRAHCRDSPRGRFPMGLPG